MDDKKKKMIAPVVVTCVMVLYDVAYFGLLYTVLQGVWKILFGVIPMLFTVVMIKVCIERIEEIKEGEEDDLSQY